jgi:hypothetical protein
MMAYFMDNTGSIVNIWRYILVLNFYIYKEWWQKQIDENLKGKQLGWASFRLSENSLFFTIWISLSGI